MPNLLLTARALTASIASIIFAGLFLHSADAQEVRFPYKGITLNANLELGAKTKIADGVILITHGGLAHNGMELVSYLQKLLKDRGYSTLAINLSLGINNRHGVYDCANTQRHTNDEAVTEIGAWVNWLKQQGATRITLLGHSRGGAQTALFANQSKSPLIKAVVLMAPATRDNTDPDTYMRNFNQLLAPLLEKAQILQRAHKGNAVLEQIGLLTCRETSATVDSFLSYYAPTAQVRVDTPTLLAAITRPVLVVVAGNDETVVGLDKKIAPLADGKRVQMKIIEGADHMFRDLSADDATDAIDVFLKSVGYAPRKS